MNGQKRCKWPGKVQWSGQYVPDGRVLFEDTLKFNSLFGPYPFDLYFTLSTQLNLNLRYRVASILFALGCVYIYSIFTASNALKSPDYYRSRRSIDDESLVTDNMTNPDVHDDHHENCSEPAYKEFPDDHMSEEVRHKGGILVHVLVVSFQSIMMSHSK